jgi:hypothetical protein
MTQLTNLLKPYVKYLAPLTLVVVGILAWYPVLNFWFLKAFEASWLHDALPYTLDRLIRTHSFLYWLDLKLFGWNPMGWYGTALVLQLVASLVLYKFTNLLTKNRLIGFIAALIFVANTAYNDVLTWGSFNSYYPLLLTWILLVFINFIRYKEDNKIASLVWSVVFTLLACYTRETGVIVVPLLTVFDLLTAGNLLQKKTWLGVLKRQIGFYVAMAGFLLLRSHYGGTIGDTVDSNVKMQMRLLHDKLYGEYFRVVRLTFGKLIPPILIPYPLLNEWRELKMKTGDADWLAINFFPILGYIGYGLLAAIALLLARAKNYGRHLIFFVIWIGAFSLFISLVIPSVHEVHIRPYEVITMRYRYFAFAGASIFYATLLVLVFDRLKKVKRLTKLVSPTLAAILILIAGYNIVALHKIEKGMYESTYKPSRDFHLKFQKDLPTLPTNSAFYIYPHAPNLNDYLFEWYLTREVKYPNLIGQPYRIESQIEAVLDKISKKKLTLNDFFFFDYRPETSLVNVTDKIRTLIAGQKIIPLAFSKLSNGQYDAQIVDGPAVELPQNVDLKINTALPSQISAGPKADSKRFRALVDYSIARTNYLETLKLTTCRTMSQRDEEPFYYYQPAHLVDGNVSRRSGWIADAVPAWMYVELPSAQPIAAVAWGSILGSTRVPASYTYAVSDDGQTWRDIKSVKNNPNATAIDKFDKPVTAKFIKMTIDTTSSGDFVQMDEFEVITTKAAAALALYSDRDSLLNDSRALFDFAASNDDLAYAKTAGLKKLWGKLSWGVSAEGPFVGTQYTYFQYDVTGANAPISVPIPEGEIYAAIGELLTRHLTSITLDLSSLSAPTTVTGQLTPRYPLN